MIFSSREPNFCNENGNTHSGPVVLNSSDSSQCSYWPALSVLVQTNRVQSQLGQMDAGEVPEQRRVWNTLDSEGQACLPTAFQLILEHHLYFKGLRENKSSTRCLGDSVAGVTKDTDLTSVDQRGRRLWCDSHCIQHPRHHVQATLELTEATEAMHLT